MINEKLFLYSNQKYGEMNRKNNMLNILLGRPINDEFIRTILKGSASLKEIIEIFNKILDENTNDEIKGNYQKILGELHEDFENKMSNLVQLFDTPKIFTEDAETQLKAIQLKLANLITISALLSKNLKSNKSEQALELYVLEFISKLKTFLSDLSLAVFRIEHPSNPYRAMILAGLFCGFLPFINIVSLIFGIHLVRLKDFRARGFGALILLIFFISVLDVAFKIL